MPPLPRAWRRVGQLLALAGGVAILVATLTPLDDPRHANLLTPLLCLICGGQGGADVAGNLLLFIPFAAGLRLAGWTWPRCVAAAAAVSFTVELLQLLVVPGRDASLSDLLTNTASGAMGAALGGALPGLASATGARAGRLLAAVLVGAFGLLALSAWLLGSDMPEGHLLSRWAHEAPGTDVFGGRVLAVQLNGRAMPPNGTPPDSARLREEVARGTIGLVTEVVSGPPAVSTSWVYMFRVPSGGAVTLGQLHRLASFTVPARALRYRFFPPMVTLPDGFPVEPGMPVVLRATERGRHVVLSSTYGGRTHTIAIRITPAFGWFLISPFLFSGGEVRWMTAACLAFLYLPAGYWAAAAGRPARAALGLAAGLALALGALPAVAALSAAPWSEWLGAVAGAALGWALRLAAAYLQTRCVSPSASEFSSP